MDEGDPRTYDNQVNFLTEQTLATLLLERSDVFDRFPDLKILVVHCGGAVTRFLTNSIGAAPLPAGGLPAGLFFDTCAYDKDTWRWPSNSAAWTGCASAPRPQTPAPR